MTTIYSLCDPTNEIPRYIGKSKVPYKRYNQHVNKAINGSEKTHKANWIRSLVKANLKPLLIIIDEVNDNEWEFWEQHYISLYKSWGFVLTNGTAGGEQFQSDESNIKRGLSSKDRFHNGSQEYRDKLLSSLKKGRESKSTLNRKGTPIICTNILTKEELTFKSIKLACEKLGLAANKINEVLDPIHKRKTHRGWSFRKKSFTEDLVLYCISDLNSNKVYIDITDHNKLDYTIKRLSTGNTYKINELTKWFKTNPQYTVSIIKQVNRYCDNIILDTCKEYILNNYTLLNERVGNYRKLHTWRKISKSNGDNIMTYYTSIVDIMERDNISFSMITEHLKGRYTSCKGQIYNYV